MAGNPTGLRTALFYLVFAVWLASAIPIMLFSLFWTQELPLWPSFGAESTREGIAVWAVFAAWFYITPIVLAVVARRRKRIGV
jgi:hypothetical protein